MQRLRGRLEQGHNPKIVRLLERQAILKAESVEALFRHQQTEHAGRKGMLRTQVLSTLAIAGFILSPSTYADDPPAETPEPVTPEAQHLKDVQADAALAKAKLEIAQSEIDLLKLKVGAIDTTNLPKGNATVTDMDLEGKLRAYAAAKQSIDLVASQIAPAITTPKRVVLATDVQLQSLNQYRSFLAQIALLKRQSDHILNKSAPKPKDPCPKGGTTQSFVAMGAATVAIDAMLSVAALFKKDIDLKGKEVTLNDFAMMTMMLQSLKANGVTAIYPAAYYILPGKSDEGQAMKEWEDLLTYKGKFAQGADKFTKEYDALPDHEKPSEVCKKKIAALKTQVDGYLAGLAGAGKAIQPGRHACPRGYHSLVCGIHRF